MPAFAIGRSQNLLYLMGRNFRDWGLGSWKIFLDSPMAIRATGVYQRHNAEYDREARSIWARHHRIMALPNVTFSRSAAQSQQINKRPSGQIIIAGSGMCQGGRIRHHLKHNVWRKECHIIIPGYQARGTLGRAIVDGAGQIRLWGETMRVAAKIHTVGGLSAHGDQEDLLDWYQGFADRPPVCLVHGESRSQDPLATRLSQLGADVSIPKPYQRMPV
jgi:metallo-beta-lactamase family protein